MNNILRNLFLLCSLLFTIQVMAQPVNCVDFSEPEIGTVFSQENGAIPGEVVYQYDGVNLLMGEFTDQNGNNWFDQISVVDPFNENLAPPSLYVNYATATFQYLEPVNVLCFTGFLSGHEINFGINGQTGVFESLLDPNIQEEWPDYEITVTSNGPTPGGLVNVCIIGPIETFTIGGIEFLLDDVCTDATLPNCAFNDPNLQAYCQNGESISISIDFASIIGDNNFVDIYLEGENYGFYPIDAFPIVLENALPAGQQNTVNVTVCINDIPECCYTETLELPTCSTESCITFAEMGNDTLFNTDTGVTPGDVVFEFPGVDMSVNTFVSADGEETFDFVALYFSPWLTPATASPPSLFFNDATATFSYDNPVNSLCFIGSVNDFPINFGINGNVGYYENLLDPAILDAFPNHNITVTLIDPNTAGAAQVCISGVVESFTIGGNGLLIDNLCSSMPVCNINNLQVVQYNCQEDIQPYRFFLTFEHNRSPLDSFNLRVAGQFYGRFAYGDLPLSELDIEVTPGTNLHFLVRDVNTEACAADLTIEAHSCEFACSDFAASLVSIECLDNTTLQALVETSSPIAGQYITIEGLSNGIIYGGPQDGPDYAFFQISGELDPEGYILGDSLTGCTTLLPPFNFNPNQCLQCELYDVIVAPTDCNPNNVYSILVDLQSTNPWEPFFVMINGDQSFGPFLPEEFPVTVGTLIGSPNELVTVEIASENDLCYYGTEFVHNCTSCEDFQAQLINIQCFENDSLLVLLNVFGVEEGEPLRITSNAHPGLVQELLFTSNPVELVFPLINANAFVLFVQAQGIDCETAIDGIEVPVDCGSACNNFSADIQFIECYEDAPYANLSILLTGIEPNGQEVLIQNTSTGTFYPIQLTTNPFVVPWPTADQGVLQITELGNGCTTEVVFNAPDGCNDNCEGLFEVIELLCSEGNPVFVFTANGPTGLPFFVRAGGEEYLFLYGQDSYELIIDGNPNEFSYQLRYRDQQAGCVQEVVVENPCFCFIDIVTADPTDCNGDGQFFVNLAFQAGTSWGTGLFLVQAGGYSETFQEGLITTNIGPFPSGSVDIIISEVNGGNCIEATVVEQNCEPNGQCGFNDIFAEPYACDGDQFMVDLVFNNPNGGPLGFYIFGDGMIFGPFAYGQNFYTFGPLNGTQANHNIMVLDIANPACFGNYQFNYSCTDECNIQQVTATPTECDGALFSVELNVIGNNLGETFTVVGNGNNYGVFNYNDLPIILGPFEGDATTSYEFGVIDLQNPGCTAFTEMEPVNCLPCDIRDLVYEVDCANEFYSLSINFIYENPESEGFRLQIGGQTIESFPYTSLPITITLPYSTIGNTLRVEDFVNELCGETIGFEVPCCSLGNIINELEVADCEDNGEYYFTVGNFNGGNLSDSLVINYAPAGSNIIATEVVAYSSLPVAIGPLTGDGATSYIVVLNDQENDCAATTTIEPVFCDNDACVEFEGVEGVFAPAFGYDSGDVITTENEVIFTYERNPSSNCACNLFVTNGVPGVNFGNGHIVATQNSGFGLNFSQVVTTFNTVNIDYFYTGGGLGISVNGQTPVIVNNLNDLPTIIAPGVELQATADANTSNTGMLTFSGDNIETIFLFTNENGGFDNVCMSMDDNVWPGDTNADNVADHVDLLSIGLAFGNTGPVRSNMTSEWTGLISQNWGDNFADGINYKHADANGDGVVNLADIQVLEQNYGLEHGPVTVFEPLPFTNIDPPIFVDLDENDQLTAGSTVEIPVVAGSADQAIEDIYGLAFTLELDPEIFTMGTLEIIYPTSWFGEPGINTATIHQIYPDGRVEVALTRTDHNNVSGFGPIMYLRIIIDDIAGVQVPTEVVVKAPRGINHSEQLLALRPGTSTAMVTKTSEGGIDRDALINSFGIFPNPTTDWVNFQNQYNMAPNRIDIFNAAGQHLQTLKEPGMHLDVRFLPAGVYMIQVHLQGHIFTEKLVKLD